MIKLTLKELKLLIENIVLEAHVRPPYPGKFVGQVFTTNDKVGVKRVPIEDRNTGKKIWIPVESMQKVRLVWDGKNWLDERDFDLRATKSPAAKPGGKESVDDFVRRGGRVKRIG